MAYTKDSIPRNHTEFGGGPGLIDPEQRKDRVFTEPHMQLWEVYATNPAPASAAVAPPGLTQAQAELAMEQRAAEIALENEPETAPLERP
jgi:hypothetical protein